MGKYALIDENGNVINTIVYDGVSKYEVDKKITVKNIVDDKFKFTEIGDKIVADSLEKVIKPDKAIK